MGHNHVVTTNTSPRTRRKKKKKKKEEEEEGRRRWKFKCLITKVISVTSIFKKLTIL
jgi:hypothetical protein